MNLGAWWIIAGAVVLWGITSLVALGFLVAQRTRAARIVFASGFLGAVLIAALVMLTFLDRQRREQRPANIVISALSLCLAGAGQFIGARRNGQAFAVAFWCAALSLLFLNAPSTGLDNELEIAGGGLRGRLSFWIHVSLLPGLAGIGLAIFLSGRLPQLAHLLMLALVNLVIFIAAAEHLTRDSYMLHGNAVANFISRTHWELVFSILAVSVVVSGGLYVYVLLPKSRNAGEKRGYSR
jgi:hypothetical protein